MDRRTIDAYEAGAEDYVRRRRANAPDDAAAFSDRVPAGAVRADLGCGPGHYTPLLGAPVLALDAAAAMLRALGARVPAAWRVQADVEALPLRPGGLGGAWASKTYQHVPPERLPLALADLHRTCAVGAPVSLVVFAGTGGFTTDADDDFPGRRFALWEADRLADVVAGAGFEDVRVRTGTGTRSPTLLVEAVRARALADTVGPGMRLLLCGLNPSGYAADAGVGFARPGNRFWPAALAAGLVTRDRDPYHALVAHGVGMTDLVKRATTSAAELSPEEYRSGLARVERLCAWLRPGAVGMVGLAGWRAARDRRATAGPQPGTLGGRPVYLMPNPSGLNAHTSVADLATHLAAAAALAPPSPRTRADGAPGG